MHRSEYDRVTKRRIRTKVEERERARRQVARRGCTALLWNFLEIYKIEKKGSS